MKDLNIILITIGAMVGGGIGLGGRIIFDWLKNRGNVPIVANNKNYNKINKWKEKIDNCLFRQKAMIEQHEFKIEYHEKWLEKGSKNFKEIKDDISQININIGILAERIKKNNN